MGYCGSIFTFRSASFEIALSFQVPHDSISLQMSQYCKPNGMAVGVAYPTQPVDDIHRTYSDKSKDSNGNRPVTVFMG